MREFLKERGETAIGRKKEIKFAKKGNKELSLFFFLQRYCNRCWGGDLNLRPLVHRNIQVSVELSSCWQKSNLIECRRSEKKSHSVRNSGTNI